MKHIKLFENFINESKKFDFNYWVTKIEKEVKESKLKGNNFVVIALEGFSWKRMFTGKLPDELLNLIDKLKKYFKSKYEIEYGDTFKNHFGALKIKWDNIIESDINCTSCGSNSFREKKRVASAKNKSVQYTKDLICNHCGKLQVNPK